MTGLADDTGTWIRRFHPGAEPAARLACFPFAGGAASYFFPVSKALAGAAEVLAVQYPGRQDRLSEPFLSTVDEMAAGVLPRLRPFAGPELALFGHSLGASVAFEVARLLEAEGTPPRALFVSARGAPPRNRDNGVHALPDEEFLAAVRRLDGMPAAVLESEELLRMALPVLRSDFRAAEHYTYRPDAGGAADLSCPVHALYGDADPTVAEDEVLEWRRHTSGAFTPHRFTGGHFYLNEHLDEVVALLRDAA